MQKAQHGEFNNQQHPQERRPSVTKPWRKAHRNQEAPLHIEDLLRENSQWTSQNLTKRIKAKLAYNPAI